MPDLIIEHPERQGISAGHRIVIAPSEDDGCIVSNGLPVLGQDHDFLTHDTIIEIRKGSCIAGLEDLATEYRGSSIVTQRSDRTVSKTDGYKAAR